VTAIPTRSFRAAGEMLGREQRCEVVELNFSGSFFGGRGSHSTTKETLLRENLLHFRTV